MLLGTAPVRSQEKAGHMLAAHIQEETYIALGVAQTADLAAEVVPDHTVDLDRSS